MPTAVESYGFGTSPWLKENGVTFKRSEQGWDTITLEYYGETNNPGVYADLHFPAGMMLTNWGFMYVTEVDVSLDGADVYVFTVQGKGLRGTQPVKRTVGQQTQSYTTGAVTLPVGGAVAQAQGMYIQPTCRFQYVTTTEPTYNIEPQDRTPYGSLPSAPSNPFAVPEPTTKIYNYPNGWVCENFEVETIAGATVWMVTESWAYRYEWMPG